MTAQSWVETTLPPGYVGYDADFLSMYGFCTGEHSHDGFTAPSERNRSAWRHWTAAVLRGRGDVRAEDYGESGGIGWRSMPFGPGVVAGRERVYVAKVEDDVWCVAVPGGAVFVSDVEEAMARFAMFVMYDQGPP